VAQLIRRGDRRNVDLRFLSAVCVVQALERSAVLAAAGAAQRQADDRYGVRVRFYRRCRVPRTGCAAGGDAGLQLQRSPGPGQALQTKSTETLDAISLAGGVRVIQKKLRSV